MKTLSPLADKILFTFSMALVVFFLVFLTANHLVSALGPQKTILFDIVLLGLIGLIASCIAMAAYRIAKGPAPLPLWIYLSTVLCLFLGIGGFMLNVLLA